MLFVQLRTMGITNEVKLITMFVDKIIPRTSAATIYYY